MESIKNKEIGLAVFTFLFSLLGNVAFYFMLLPKPSFDPAAGVLFTAGFILLATLFFLPLFIFISGFLYCLVFKQDISLEFSENVSKYFIIVWIMFLLILLLSPARSYLISTFGIINIATIIFVLVILMIWYFGSYLTLIYSSRFYNFLKKLIVKK